MSNTNSTPDNFEEMESLLSLEGWLLVLLASAIGAVAALFVLPSLGPVLGQSLTGTNPQGYWYLARAAGLVAYLLLWLSVAFGLIITNKFARLWPGGPTAFDLHQFTSLLALAFTVFHGLVLLGDQYINFSLVQLLIPFSDTYRPFWVGLGQLAFYLAIPVAFSFYARKSLGYKTWRLLHYGSFAVYFLVTLHGLFSGTDSTTLSALAMYGMTALTTVALIVYRVFASRSQAGKVRLAS